MELSPDSVVFWTSGGVSLNLTIVATWVVMGLLGIGSWMITRRLTPETEIPPWQNALESLVALIRKQVVESGLRIPEPYLGFLGTLFLFIVVSNGLAIVPGFHPPTGSLSTTAALATCVFLAVPLYGIAELGWVRYLGRYSRPSILMLPLHVLSEITRTVALAVRLFGNVMSEGVLVGILTILAPLFFPVIMQLFGLLMGFVQAYIFAVLAAVFLAAATGREEH